MRPDVARPSGIILMACALLAWSLPASAQEARLVAAAPGQTLSTEAAQARVGAAVRVVPALLAADGQWRCAVPRVRVEGRLRRCAGPLPSGTTIRWIHVEPRMQHVDLPAPNPGIPSFSNAVLTGPEHGRWLGFDTLEYTESPLTSAAGVEVGADALTLRAARPADPRRDRHGGAGTVFLSAELTLPDGTRVTTPGARETDRFGLTRRVLRVSFREADDMMGWLSTYFLVPNVFGSSGPGRDHQSDRYVGADCADVLVGAVRAMGRPLPYVSVAGLSRIADPRSEVLLQDADGHLSGAGDAPALLRWGHEVERGDYVTLDYADPADHTLLPRAWDHIGALVGDTNGNGVLDGPDLLRHMSHRGLIDQPLREQGHARMRVHRLRGERAGRRARRESSR